MNFHEERFPAALSIGAIGGPERRTEIVTLDSGFEERNTPWSHSRRRYDAGVAMQSLDDLANVTAFFEARRGQLFGFRWKDWTDWKSCVPSDVPSQQDQQIGVGDDETVTFQLRKTYKSGSHDYVREITKPCVNTVLVAISGGLEEEGNSYSVDHEAGLVTFAEAPGEGALITAGFEYDVPVRFDSDRLETSHASFLAGEIPSVPIVEVRV